MAKQDRSRAPRATFGHAGRVLTVEMIVPRLAANGKPIGKVHTTYPRINSNAKASRHTVTGYFTYATFTVTGWRHPIEFRTMATIFGYPITIGRITIGTDEPLGAVDYETQGQITLDGLPMGKLLNAALQASAFTAYAWPHRTTAAIDGRQMRVNMDNAPPFMVLHDASEPLEFISIGGNPTAIANDAKVLAGSPQIAATHRADDAPIKSPAALKRIADLFGQAETLGKAGRGHQTIAKWIEHQTNGKRPAATVQQMICWARDAKLLDRRKPQPKPKRGKSK